MCAARSHRRTGASDPTGGESNFFGAWLIASAYQFAAAMPRDTAVAPNLVQKKMECSLPPVVVWEADDVRRKIPQEDGSIRSHRRREQLLWGVAYCVRLASSRLRCHATPP